MFLYRHRKIDVTGKSKYVHIPANELEKQQREDA